MANEFKVKKGLIVDGSNTVLDIQGTLGQLFSVTDSLTGDLFSVSDVSGIPILNVNSSGSITTDGSHLTILDGHISLKQSTDSGFTTGLTIERSANTQKLHIGMDGGAVNFNSPDGLAYKFRNNGTEKFTVDGSGNVTVTGNVESQDTFILNYNNAGNKWQQLFDGSNGWNLRYYNGTSWSSNYINVNTSGNATFTGDARFNSRVRIGDVTGLSNRGTVRIDTRGDAPADLLFGRDTAGTATSWNNVYWSLSSRDSTQGNTFRIYRGTAHDSPYNSEAIPFTLNPDLSANFSGEVEIHNEGNDTTGKLIIAGNNNTGTPGQKTNATFEHRGADLKTVITHNSADVITIGTDTLTTFEGNINMKHAKVIGLQRTDGVAVGQVYMDSNDNLIIKNSGGSGHIELSPHPTSGNLYSNSPLIATSGAFSGNVSCAFFSNSSGGKFEVQNATDGTSAKGIYMWDSSDTNWGIYMSQAGSGKALNDGNAVAGIDGRTEHAIRFRVNDSTSQIGFLWENSSQEALMQLQADTGKLFTRGEIYPSNQTTAYVDSTRIGQWNTAHGWGNHASGGYAADNAVVKTSGNQSVGGIKTFTSNAIFEEKVIIGDNSVIETTFPASGASLHVHEKVSGSGVAFGNEAHVVISTGATSTGAQGYQGSLWFGSSDHPAAGSTAGSGSQFVWRNAGIASTSGTADTGGASATGNLEFYTNNASGTATKRLEIEAGGNATFAGDVAINSTSNVGLTLEHATRPTFTFTDGTNNAYLGLESGGAIITGTADNDFSIRSPRDIVFGYNGTETARINTSGNATFAGTVKGTLAKFDTLNNGANSANIIYRTGTNTIVGNNATALVIEDGGEVGIGLNNPSALLHVRKDQAALTSVIIQNNSGSGASAKLEVSVGETGSNDPTVSYNIGNGGYDWTTGVDNSDGDSFKISGGTDSHNVDLGTNTRLTIPAEGGLDIQGTIGQLFSVTNSLTGDLFSVSDVSGVPILNVNSSGVVEAEEIKVGSSQQIQIYHDGSNGHINENGTGSLIVSSAGPEVQIKGSSNVEYMARFFTNAGVKLYYNNSETLTVINGGVNITGTMTATSDVVAYSDKKLKENIKTLDGSKVLKMRGVSFDRIDTGVSSSGVIAQEMQKVAPELVSETDGTLGVSYGNITGYLIEAIKELKAEIEELKKQIK